MVWGLVKRGFELRGVRFVRVTSDGGRKGGKLGCIVEVKHSKSDFRYW